MLRRPLPCLLTTLLLFPAAACVSDPAPADDDDAVDDDDAGDDDDARPGVVDCDALPEPEPERIVEGARGSKGLAFDTEGHIIGKDAASLIKATYDGDWSVWVPSPGEVEGMLRLDDGDLLITSSWGDGIRRVSPEGGIAPLAPDLLAYGVAIGPAGRIWAAGWDGVWRVDPETGEYDTLLDTSGEWDSYRSVAFSRDKRRVYLGTVSAEGRIHHFDLDEAGEPTGDLELYVEGVGHGWHDGLGIDVCGDIWAADYDSSALYRVSPEGDVTTVVDWSDEPRWFGHGLRFGPGIGGWRADAIYMPVPEADNVVREIVVGVPENTWEGEVRNGPDR